MRPRKSGWLEIHFHSVVKVKALTWVQPLVSIMEVVFILWLLAAWKLVQTVGHSDGWVLLTLFYRRQETTTVFVLLHLLS